MFSLAIASLALVFQESNPLQNISSAKQLHLYDLIDVDWTVKIDPAKGFISGKVINTVKIQKPGDLLLFDAVKLKLSKIEVDGKVQPYIKNSTVWGVRAPADAKPGDILKVTIIYEGSPEAGIYFVPKERAYPAKTDVAFTQGEMEDTRFWLPTYDSPDDKATSRGTIIAPKDWSVLSNGELDKVTKVGESSIWKWSLNIPHSTYLISLVGGRYSQVPDGVWEGIKVTNWIPEGLEAWGDAAFGGTHKIVAFYSKLTGFKYPWGKYAQSAVPDFMFGGMENVSATTQTITSIFPATAKPNQDATGLVAHELAHQWFGDTVTTPKWDHIWINEGWATFLPHFWFRESQGEDAFHLERFNTYNGALDASRNSDRSMVFDGWKEPIEMFDGFAYPGGSTRMMMLMHSVGEEKFWPAVTAYLNEHKFKNVDTDQFFKTFSRELGVNLDEFKKQWFYTKGAPKIVVKRTPGGYQLTQVTPGFNVPLEYEVIGADGKRTLTAFTLTAGTTAEVPVAAGDTLVVDPGYWLMADIEYPNDYSADDIYRAFTSATNVAQKLRLARAPFFSKLSQEKITELIKKEKSWMVVRDLLERSKDDMVVLGKLSDKDPRIVEKAAWRLIYSPNNKKFVGQLRAMYNNSTNDEVKYAAFNTLYRITQDKAMIEEAWKTKSYNEAFRVAALTWWEETDKDRARGEALMAVAKLDSAPVRNHAIGMLGRLKDKPGERIVFKTLTGLMNERAYSPLSAAINALAEYGDKEALPVLETRKNHSLHFLRKTVAAAIERLKG